MIQVIPETRRAH